MMTPKQQYRKAYSAVRFEMIDWSEPPLNLDKKRSAVEELLELPSHIVGVAYQHWLVKTYTVDKLSHREHVKDYMLFHFPDYVFVSRGKGELRPKHENANPF